MSSGSFFTLYRKYNIQATDEVIEKLKKRYIDSYDKTSYSDNDKTDDDYINKVPLILNFNYNKETSKYCEETKEWVDISDKSLNGIREDYLAILSSDKSYLDELITWHFCSSFTALKEQWNLNNYEGAKSQYIVSKLEAEQILQACNYLLSEKWSDEFEKILNNQWVNILANPDRGDRYWKYIYRNNPKELKGLSEEELNSAKYDLDHLKKILESYLNSFENYNNDKILVYTVW